MGYPPTPLLPTPPSDPALAPTPPPAHRRPSLMGPVVLITLGVMFMLEQYFPGWGISRTWPVLLVIIGVLKLLDSARPPRAPQGPRI